MKELRDPRFAARRRTVRGTFIRLLNDEDLPLNERLYRRIRDLILSGSLPNGSRLASSRALAANLCVSRNSVLTALDRLLAEGWLESRRNSGVYVTYSGKRIATPHAARSRTPQTGSTPFELGWATDIFPLRIWQRLQMRHWRKIPGYALQQGERAGLPALRKAIATHVAVTRGLECSSDQIIVTTCIPAGIDLAARALGIPAEAWIEDPGCRSPVDALRRLGVRLAPVPVDAEGFDVETAIRFAPFAKLALVTPSCQAPTGVPLGQERRHKLLAWATATSGWIFEDDFNWTEYSDRSSVPPLATLDPSRTIYFNSFNNTLFPGLRIAYVIAPPDLIDRFAAVRGTEGDVNAPNQVVLADFIEGGHLHDHLKRLNASDAERRAALQGSIAREMSEFLVPHDSAGGYFTCTANAVSESALTAECAARDIVVTGMSNFRMIPSDRTEIVLGFSQHKPEALSDAATRLRGVFDTIRAGRTRGIQTAGAASRSSPDHRAINPASTSPG